MRSAYTLLCLGMLAACSGGKGEVSPADVSPREAPERRARLTASGYGTCVIREDERVFCWGEGLGRPWEVSALRGAVELARGGLLCGRFADGRVRCRAGEGYEWVAGLTGAVQIAVGQRHACALRGDGTVLCWEGAGEPYPIPGLGEVRAISAHRSTTCAVTAAGALRCWTRRGAPAAPDGSEAEAGAREVAVGAHHTCVTEADRVRCFGRGDAELGEGGSTLLREPRTVAVGRSATCAIDARGALACWGAHGLEPRLGQPPTEVGSGFLEVALGERHACGLRRDGEVLCWGNNAEGQVLGHPTEILPPTRVVSIEDALSVRTSRAYNCALREGGVVTCWGGLYSYERDDVVHSSPIPETIEEVRGTTDLALGLDHLCALVSERVLCWGDGSRGQLGSTGAPFRERPAPVEGLGPMTAISAAGDHTCARGADGSAWCWGSWGSWEAEPQPPRRVEGLGRVESVQAGLSFDCAVRGGRVRCGSGGEGFAPVPGLGRVDALRMSGPFACARAGGGPIRCWGAQLPDTTCGDALGEGCPSAPEPVVVRGLDHYPHFSAGSALCAWDTGAPECRVANVAPIGPAPTRMPRELADLRDVVDLSTSDSSSCAVHRSGHVTCWGYNQYGQVGMGVGIDVTEPTQVALGEVP